MAPSLKTTVAGIPLSTCVYNASGPRTGTAAALSKVAASSSGGVLAKSATLVSQTGNPQPRTWHDPNGMASFNSEGLPNNGIDYYIDSNTIKETFEGISETKPYMVSISGKTLDDNLKMMDKIKAAGGNSIACVELNLACPNIIGKPIIAYDFDQMKMILSTIKKRKYKFVLGLKLPPYLDSKQLQQAASVINEFSDMVGYVASINTIGNSLAVDEISEAPFISSNNGLAGLSGPAVKYTALANVRQMRNHLDASIDVVGVGGIESGIDAFQFILCGATAVQVGTCHWKEGPQCFDRICQELETIMKEKGYDDIASFCGKIKSWSKEGAALSRTARKEKEANAKAAAESDTKAAPAKPASDFPVILNNILIVAIAILVAEKLGVFQFLLPEEEQEEISYY